MDEVEVNCERFRIRRNRVTGHVDYDFLERYDSDAKRWRFVESVVLRDLFWNTFGFDIEKRVKNE